MWPDVFMGSPAVKDRKHSGGAITHCAIERPLALWRDEAATVVARLAPENERVRPSGIPFIGAWRAWAASRRRFQSLSKGGVVP